MHIHIHIHMCIHAYIHTCTHSLSSGFGLTMWLKASRQLLLD